MNGASHYDTAYKPVPLFCRTVLQTGAQRIMVFVDLHKEVFLGFFGDILGWNIGQMLKCTMIWLCTKALRNKLPVASILLCNSRNHGEKRAKDITSSFYRLYIATSLLHDLLIESFLNPSHHLCCLSRIF